MPPGNGQSIQSRHRHLVKPGGRRHTSPWSGLKGVSVPGIIVVFISSHQSLYPLCFVLEIRYCDERTGMLTNEITGDRLVLLDVVARVGYGGKHVELDFVCDGKSGVLESGIHRQVPSEEGEGAKGDPEC